MASTSTLRWRRSAAQFHALEQVEREIRSTDPNGRRKYLQDFSRAFRTYQSVLTSEQLWVTLSGARTLLVGDYHALPASQRFAASLVRTLAADRPVILGVETVFSRDQHLLDAWFQGRISEPELRAKLRFDLDWGYPWEPFYELLRSARDCGAPVYGLDCRPRDDLRKISLRDQHAATTLAELRRLYPEACLVAVFGESHLAPSHLPRLVRRRLPKERIVTVLQNVDSLYWKAAGERSDRVDAVRISDSAVCVFNSTPLEKYESYRLCLDRWRQARSGVPDFAPSVHNLIESLARFLDIARYGPQYGRTKRFVRDHMPEVCFRRPENPLRRAKNGTSAIMAELMTASGRLEEYGSAYLPTMNSIYVRDFQMAYVAEEAAHFLHHACRGSLDRPRTATRTLRAEDRFYRRALEHAIGYFGSRVLCPARPAIRESELAALYRQPQRSIERRTVYRYSEYMRMIDLLVLHKQHEKAVCTGKRRGLIAEGLRWKGAKFEYLTRRLGYMLGSDLYDSYLEGRVSQRFLCALLFRSLDEPGRARATYFAVVRRFRRS
jgi:hypothetical protein